MIDQQNPSSFEAEAGERLILAMDFPAATEAFDFLLRLREEVRLRWVKVGLELFLAAGPGIVDALHEQGYAVFLDLKLHDIPNTVAAAIRVLGGLGAEMLTVHAAGGPAMLRAAAEAGALLAKPPRMLAVTVLTSMDRGQLAATGVDGPAEEQVLRLARVAFEAGVGGLVASPLEATRLRGEEGIGEMHLVTPGIRAAGAGDDQQRVATAAEAIRAGASQLVVGRPITRAADPGRACRGILGEIERALEGLGGARRTL